MCRFLIFLFVLIPMCCGLTYSRSTSGIRKVQDSVQADLDWKFLKESSTVFTRTEEERRRYKNGTAFEKKIFEDSISIARVQRAEDFLRKYPDDKRKREAIIELIQANPRFYSKSQVDNKEDLQSSIGEEKLLNYYRFLRSLQIDHQAEKKWLDQTDLYIQELIENTTTREEKEEASFLLILRDFNRAISMFREIGPVNSQQRGSDYWTSVSQYFWDSMLKRLLSHIDSFSDIALLKGRTVNLLSVLDSFAPKLVAEYWETIFEKTAGRTEVGLIELNKHATALLKTKELEDQNELNISFPSMSDGKEIALDKLRGKVVLIDFWATWCSPCIQELPKLAELYEKYHDKGFEILGICLDSESARERALKVLKENGATWPQRFQGVGFSSDDYVSLYRISSLPTVWLIDKNGKVIERDARGEKLEKLILQNLGK